MIDANSYLRKNKKNTHKKQKKKKQKHLITLIVLYLDWKTNNQAKILQNIVTYKQKQIPQVVLSGRACEILLLALFNSMIPWFLPYTLIMRVKPLCKEIIDVSCGPNILPS